MPERFLIFPLILPPAVRSSFKALLVGILASRPLNEGLSKAVRPAFGNTNYPLMEAAELILS